MFHSDSVRLSNCCDDSASLVKIDSSMADNTSTDEVVQSTSHNMSSDADDGLHPSTSQGNMSQMPEWESPVKLAPRRKKRRLSLDIKKCAVCQQMSSEKLIRGTSAGSKSVIDASRIRQDDLCGWLSEEYGDIGQINSETVCIMYHRKCMQAYTSKSNLQYVKKSEQSSDAVAASHEDDCGAGPSHVRRASVTPVDWSCCTICSKKTHKKDRRLVKIQTLDRDSALKQAALSKNDEDMLRKISTVDLIAQEALYHSACFSTYVRKATETKTESGLGFDSAFMKLIADIDNDLMQNKKAFHLTSLLAKLKVYLPKDKAVSFRSYQLQRKLEMYYGDAISVESQHGQGMSSIVFSSNITPGDAIKAVADLKKDVKASKIEEEVSSNFECNQEHTLYLAATILRNDIGTYKPSETYPSPGEMGLSECAQQMPPLITKFVEWLVDKNSYAAATSAYVPPHDILRHCVALTECIVSTCQKTPTPFQVGLAIQLHHEYGSRSLIDTLHSHGLCISYDELRRFITSVAAIELERIKDDTYAPSGIIPISCGGSLIQEGDDNVDINTETIDGKDTFHSMARVVFQQQEPNMTDVTMDRIKRGQEKVCQSMLTLNL